MQQQDQIIDNLADTSKPNAGRIYDYILGGGFNFEIDRQVADQLIAMLPFMPKMARLQRWCLGDLASELTYQRGFDVIIDFASGLPADDHIHVKAKSGTVVIYSDWDEVTVLTAQAILKDNKAKNAHYFHADARYPEKLLNDPDVVKLLDGRRDVAVIYWGVGSFLADDDIAHAARVIYDWTGPKACFAFNAQGADADGDNPLWRQLREVYQNMGTKTFPRSLKRYEELLYPWHLEDKGFVSLLSWHGFDRNVMTPEDLEAYGESGGGYGAYLTK